jgi:hypothetical protein
MWNAIASPLQPRFARRLASKYKLTEFVDFLPAGGTFPRYPALPSMRTQTDTKRKWTAKVCTWQIGPIQREMRTDEQLMLAFAQGEESAFDELFLRYWEKLRVFFARRSEERSRAEELAQIPSWRCFERWSGTSRGRCSARISTGSRCGCFARRARLRALLFLPSASKEPTSHVADEEVESDVRSNSISIHEAAKQPPSGVRDATFSQRLEFAAGLSVRNCRLETRLRHR